MKINYCSYPTSIKLLFIVYFIGFAVGTTTHTMDLIKGGFFPYTWAPLWKNIYWTILTFFDFLTIFLIFKSIPVTLILSNIIILSDILINTNGFQSFIGYRLVFQIAFGLYIWITTPIVLWKYKRTNYNGNYSL